jgi:hypothetical protein
MQQEKTHPDLSLFLITQMAITMGDYYQIMRIFVVCTKLTAVYKKAI